MKFARNNDKHKVRANVEMTPIIDVVFQLLIFFMLTSTFVVQSSIPIEVPESSTEVPQMESKSLEITLSYGEGGPDNQGKVVLTIDDSVEVNSWNELRQFLQAHKLEHPEEPVQIRADKRVPTQRLVELMGQLDIAGLKRYSLAAKSLESGD